jgi:hypothetical protein
MKIYRACKPKNIVLSISLILFLTSDLNAQDQTVTLLQSYQYDASGSGQQFLLNEARNVSFFLLGELHGEQEIPNLLFSLWPEMYNDGYRHVAAEVSPWAADKLNSGKGKDSLSVEGLWTNSEAHFFLASGNAQGPMIWGCDMEEISLDLMIQDFAAQHSSDTTIKTLQSKITKGYNRKMAPDLLNVLVNYKALKADSFPSPLYESIVSSLKIDSARVYPDSKFKAQQLREELMKDYFIMHYKSLPKKDSPKILLRFGRNHLHRGFDSRGISTLGNFVSEFAIAEKMKTFNVAAFACGGQISLMGQTFDADERTDDPAFYLLWQQANFNSTIFDLRPLRRNLHQINSTDRTDLQKRLLYWADSYDAIICYKKVTPRKN